MTAITDAPGSVLADYRLRARGTLNISLLPPSIYKRVYEGFNYRLRVFAGGRWASRCRPVTIVFLLTERCNARCLHCDIWKNSGKEETPSLEALKATIQEIRDWLGPVQVTFTGGEALLKPYTPELVRYASSIGLMVELLTHGYWEDQARIEQLALAHPYRVTISFDGVGSVHDKVRGREGFFARTARTIDTLRRMRSEHDLKYTILLKTVLMRHNLDEAVKIADFAAENRLEVFYQPIEQNYNTSEDAEWFKHSENWPSNPDHAIAVVKSLINQKRAARPITNSFEQLEVMADYFRDPAGLRVSIQNHTAHERRPICSALTNIQVQANGDVVLCPSISPVGNISQRSIRDIWKHRPHLWEKGCCLEWRTPSASD